MELNPSTMEEYPSGKRKSVTFCISTKATRPAAEAFLSADLPYLAARKCGRTSSLIQLALRSGSANLVSISPEKSHV